MHTNHRRAVPKDTRYYRSRYGVGLAEHRTAYWRRERARERHLMAHGRYDDLQNAHPKCVLWDAL